MWWQSWIFILHNLTTYHHPFKATNLQHSRTISSHVKMLNCMIQLNKLTATKHQTILDSFNNFNIKSYLITMHSQQCHKQLQRLFLNNAVICTLLAYIWKYWKDYFNVFRLKVTAVGYFQCITEGFHWRWSM